MKSIILLSVVALAAGEAAHRRMFAEWTQQYQRNYSSTAEYELRLRHFRANLEQIELLNRRHAGMQNGARFGVNKYADLSREEQRRLRGFRMNKAVRDSFPAPVKVDDVPLNLAVDWRMRNVVAPIQDQAMCGSCWAFSTTSNIESQTAFKNNKSVVKLAEQQLVDCDKTCGKYRGFDGCDAGCDGGLQPNAFTWVQSNGQTFESNYPYTGVGGKCKSGEPVATKIRGFIMIPENETAIAQWVQVNGPASIAVDASEWTFYFGGIMRYLCWGTEGYDDLDHAVNIVGFGGTGENAYWLIRNSWGIDWGESGYAQIIRGDEFCGVQLFASSSQAV